MLKEILINEAQKPEDEILSIITNVFEYESWIGDEIFKIADKYGFLFRFQLTPEADDIELCFSELISGKYTGYVIGGDYNNTTLWAFKKSTLKKCLAEMQDMVAQDNGEG